ncbi:winged helix-turn-helix transcriptional regulator [Rhodococcus triatomae]|uniref:ArsR family transcriptional regulator n=1 Tax=Rhodococcus triatomae TaxID=300028 RepID=A0A1G8H0K4_9NOCA|nr:metalloregulator ArsR/SmtB family transcription factor [Rhodococcus triatomae]QNG20241.1 winged helix-turn-helix transcriptional regulator [Rhodococcus triatomae]QNG23844.1 winged helix-turn-helix transcriptional regulator [Rhodococcus triatomae]SDI00212.1 ArsR family transcriptional regulator [Rhodococcus triatomae]
MTGGAAEPASVSDELGALLPVFKALSDPTRQEIVRVLLRAEGEPVSVSVIVDATGLPQSTVSRHLSVLKTTHIATDSRHGTERRYRITLDRGHLAALGRLTDELRRCASADDAG